MKCAATVRSDLNDVDFYDTDVGCQESPIQGSYFCKFHFNEKPLYYPGTLFKWNSLNYQIIYLN
jgi:hypothetical protein